MLKDRIKLRLKTKKRTNKIEISKEEVENNDDKLLHTESKISKLLTDLKYKEEDILNYIRKSKTKIRKVRIITCANYLLPLIVA